MPGLGSRSTKLEELAKRLAESNGLADLEVEAGETRVLTFQSSEMRKFFTTIEVDNAKALKDMIGVPDEAVTVGAAPLTSTLARSRVLETTLPIRAEGLRVNLGSLATGALPARTINPAILTDPAAETSLKQEATAVARVATEPMPESAVPSESGSV
ncbi:hypothetical protein [Ectothiorhodospira shaposhnikovii]|uniref:hypothetical protein n=1 Tax=Ectothiorhodospira shaposhnikovii TaxID=1054 RepID=UPI001EE79CFC|nr:hypothetical protein [Ectothiorhodospira shaposhnikovii]MCG5514390.1 hypothetical protein [Ectothiorhodospira shaposhnikovii]